MSTTTPRPALTGLYARRVAEVTGLSEMELYRHHASDMGSPGHFFYERGAMVYTAKGLSALVEALAVEGQMVAAKLLAAALQHAAEKAPARDWLGAWEDRQP